MISVKITMASCQFRVLFHLAVAGYVWGSVVIQKHSSYSCCERNLKTEFNRSCDNTWTVNDMNVAAFNDETMTDICTPPCQKIKDGVMTLSGCHDVTLTTVCKNHAGKLQETKDHHHGDPCNNALNSMALKHQGPVLLLVMMVGVFMRWMSY